MRQTTQGCLFQSWKQVTAHFIYDLNFASELRYGILKAQKYLSFFVKLPAMTTALYMPYLLWVMLQQYK